MAHQLSPRVKQIVVKLTQELYRLLEKEASRRQMSVTQYVRFVLGEATLNIELTEKDYEVVNDRIKAAALRLNSKKATG